ITKPKIDILSIIQTTSGYGGIVFGVSNAGEGSGGWTSPTVIVSLIVGVVGHILFSIRQLTMKQPMINIRAFKYPMFILGVLMVFICM
ncbi:MFS transporter, partial [Bacillus vallismortis]|nr:MFS transporter [Bacillus vallismortis]